MSLIRSLTTRSRIVAALALLAMPIVLSGQGGVDADLVKRARAIHDRVITLDTHADISPANFTRERNYTQDLPMQVNLPKMFGGGLDAAFFIVYVGQCDLTPAGYDDAYKCARQFAQAPGMHQPDIAASNGSGVGGHRAKFVWRPCAKRWLDPQGAAVLRMPLTGPSSALRARA